MKHIVIREQTFRVGVYRDQAGNFVADARGPFRYAIEDGRRSDLVARAVAGTPRHAIDSVTETVARMYATPAQPPPG